MSACHWGPRRPNPLKFCTKVVYYIFKNCSKFRLAIFEVKDFIVRIVSGLVFLLTLYVWQCRILGNRREANFLPSGAELECLLGTKIFVVKERPNINVCTKFFDLLLKFPEKKNFSLDWTLTNCPGVSLVSLDNFSP